jgi:hypothetical protein
MSVGIASVNQEPQQPVGEVTDRRKLREWAVAAGAAACGAALITLGVNLGHDSILVPPQPSPGQVLEQAVHQHAPFKTFMPPLASN